MVFGSRFGYLWKLARKRRTKQVKVAPLAPEGRAGFEVIRGSLPTAAARMPGKPAGSPVGALSLDKIKLRVMEQNVRRMTVCFAEPGEEAFKIG